MAHTSVNASSIIARSRVATVVLVPRVALPALGPLEVRRGDAAGVGQDVGHDHDAPAVEHGVGRRAAWARWPPPRSSRRPARSATVSSMTPARAAGTSELALEAPTCRPRRWGRRPRTPRPCPRAATWSDSATGVEAAGVVAPRHPRRSPRSTRMPADDSRKASGPPTLPKPWMTARLADERQPQLGERGAGADHARRSTWPPAWPARAADRQRLAGDRAGQDSPRTIDSVSMSQAITRPSVLTSGAGTSLSGPSSGEISSV